MSQPLILASCFLPLDADTCRWWLKLQEALAQEGMELIVLSQAPPADPNLRVILVPLWLQGYAAAFGNSPTALTLEEPLAQALVERERSWSGQAHQPLAEFHAGLQTCQHVLRTLLAELQPAVVLTWGSSLPQSVVLQQLALQEGRPCWVLERGFVPQTLMVEMSGQGGLSEWNASFALQRALRAGASTTTFRAVQQQYVSQRASKTPVAADALSAEELRRRHCPDRQRLVSVLLQHDEASGLSPVSFAGSRQHTRGLTTAAEAVQHLAAAAAARTDCQLIVRPHPLDLADYSAFESATLRVVRDGSLHALLQASDAVACMTSTCQFEALLYEKPLILLARSVLAGKGVAYEALNPSAVAPALAAALAFDGFVDRLERGRRFLSFALENFLITLDEEVPGLPTLRDLAAWLGTHSGTPLALPPTEDRLLGVRSWFSLWAKTKTELDQARNAAPAAAPAAGSPSASVTTPVSSTMNCHSHIGQDAWVAECLRFRRGGFFLDFGAFDGTSISNTLTLERDLGWRGICVEPNPRYYPALCAARRCITVNAALWHESRKQLEFVDAHGLSSIADFKDTDINSQRRQEATRSLIRVDTLNPNELLERFDAPTLIDFLSLDVEGAEFDILNALDLRRYRIALMTIEHNHNHEHQKRIRDYLAGFGYEVVQNRNDDFFFHRAHLAALMENLGGAPDPLAAFDRVYATFPIAATGAEAQPFAYGPPLAPPPVTSPTVPSAATPPARRRPAGPAAPLAAKDLRVAADEAYAQEHWTEAGNLYKTLSQTHPDELEVWKRRIHCARSAGHEVLADLVLEEALESHPGWAAQLGPPVENESGSDSEVILGVEGRSYGF